MTSSDDRGTGYDLVVVGAHLAGEPLSWQLTDRGGRFVTAVRTAPCYRLFALPTDPPKPGLVRVGDRDGGAPIEGERWRLDAAGFASFVAAIPSPLGIAAIALDDGQLVQGFACEAWACADALDITGYGGWRAYRSATAR